MRGEKSLCTSDTEYTDTFLLYIRGGQMSIVQKFCLIFFCVFYKNNQLFLCKTNYETMKTVQIKLTHTV